MDIKGIKDILGDLSNEDAIIIFTQASTSLKRYSDNYKVLGMTKKRYYSRLRTLVRRGLLKRNRYEYNQTSLGKLVHEFLLKLSDVVENQKKIYQTDILERNQYLESIITNRYL